MEKIVYLKKSDWEKIAQEFNKEDLPQVTELSTDESIEERAKNKYPLSESVKSTEKKLHDAFAIAKQSFYIEGATEQSLIEQMKAKEKKYKENRDTFETHHCGNILTEKEIDYDHCLQCGEYLQED